MASMASPSYSSYFKDASRPRLAPIESINTGNARPILPPLFKILEDPVGAPRDPLPHAMRHDAVDVEDALRHKTEGELRMILSDVCVRSKEARKIVVGWISAMKSEEAGEVRVSEEEVEDEQEDGGSVDAYDGDEIPELERQARDFAAIEKLLEAAKQGDTAEENIANGNMWNGDSWRGNLWNSLGGFQHGAAPASRSLSKKDVFENGAHTKVNSSWTLPDEIENEASVLGEFLGRQRESDFGSDSSESTLASDGAFEERGGIKRKAEGRIVECTRCEECYDTEEDKDEECNYHPGELEINLEADMWYDWNEGFGPEDSQENKDQYPEGFIWTCCGEQGDGCGGCEEGKHVEKAKQARKC